MIATWKDIPGYEGCYQASDQGEIRSLDRDYIDKSGKHKHLTGRILKPNASRDYLSIELNVAGHHTSHSVHRLIALAFIPNPENKPTVNHKDGDRFNNVASNLEWATYSENNQHAHDLGLNTSDPNKSGATTRSNEVTRRSVYCVETDTTYISRSECARQLGIWSSSITDSIQHDRPVKCKGKVYTFKNVDNN